MDNSVTTFLKTNDGFQSIDNYSGKISDTDYIEGAIVLQIANNEILGLEQWDLVDQLWAYLREGIEEVDSRGEFKTFFPDQPLLLEIKKISQELAMITIGDSKTVVSFRELKKLILNGEKAFNKNLSEILEGARK